MNTRELKLFTMLTDKSKKIINVELDGYNNIRVDFDNHESVKIIGFSDGLDIYYNDETVPIYK